MVVAFVFLASMTLLCAMGVVLSRNVVHSALLMSGSFFGVAGFFVMLNAPVLAAFQVLIYVGAVTVVILFGIMFTQKPQVRRFGSILQRQRWSGFFVAIGVGAFLAYIMGLQNWDYTEPGNGPQEASALGEILLGVNGAPQIFSLLFEVISILLLVAVIAAIVVSRRKSGEGIDRQGTDREEVSR
ncbi:NADH-quinone oxidoreductase subunit J [soil metagenome]